MRRLSLVLAILAIPLTAWAAWDSAALHDRGPQLLRGHLEVRGSVSADELGAGDGGIRFRDGTRQTTAGLPQSGGQISGDLVLEPDGGHAIVFGDGTRQTTAAVTYELPPIGGSTLGGIKGDGTDTSCAAGEVVMGFRHDGAMMCASNMVTTDTAQAIAGSKTFASDALRFQDSFRIHNTESTTNAIELRRNGPGKAMFGVSNWSGDAVWLGLLDTDRPAIYATPMLRFYDPTGTNAIGEFSAARFRVGKSTQIEWSSDTAATATEDTGLIRAEAGIVRVTTGDASRGGLQVQDLDAAGDVIVGGELRLRTIDGASPSPPYICYVHTGDLVWERRTGTDPRSWPRLCACLCDSGDPALCGWKSVADPNEDCFNN